MTKSLVSSTFDKGFSLLARMALFFIATGPHIYSSAEDCARSGRFVCDIPSAEDLVQVPDTRWIVASAFAGPMLLNLIDSQTRSWSVLFPSDTSKISHDRKRFPFCPGPADNGSVVSHGLHLTETGSGHSTLHVVSHGDREAIEVFSIRVTAADTAPEVTWVGCIPLPEGMAANSVVALSNGDLLASVPLEPGYKFSQAFEDVKTGAIYRWTKSDNHWARLDATAQPYPNGVEVSADESMFYVASSGLRKILSYTNTTHPRIVDTTEEYGFVPDNLHRDATGQLLTAGLDLEYEGCRLLDETGKISNERYASCARPYQIISVNGESMETTTLLRGVVDPGFSNVTMAVEVSGELWIGTFAGNRVAIEASPK